MDVSICKHMASVYVCVCDFAHALLRDSVRKWHVCIRRGCVSETPNFFIYWPNMNIRMFQFPYDPSNFDTYCHMFYDMWHVFYDTEQSVSNLKGSLKRTFLCAFLIIHIEKDNLLRYYLALVAKDSSITLLHTKLIRLSFPGACSGRVVLGATTDCMMSHTTV